MARQRFSQYQPKRKRSIALLFVLALALVGSVGYGVYQTMRSERALSVIDPASELIEDEEHEEHEEDYEVYSIGGRNFDPASELSIDEKERYDSQRRDDIQQIHQALQAYRAKHGEYPRLSNLNSDRFRETHFPELDREVFRDPEDSASQISLTRTPQQHVYAYDVLNDQGYTCEPVGRACVTYTLTTTLSGGLLYSIDHNE